MTCRSTLSKTPAAASLQLLNQSRLGVSGRFCGRGEQGDERTLRQAGGLGRGAAARAAVAAGI